jgi:hypothetical protein
MVGFSGGATIWKQLQMTFVLSFPNVNNRHSKCRLGFDPPNIYSIHTVYGPSY